MFVKLLKHEWRATRGTLGVLTLVAVALGLFATLETRFMISDIWDNVTMPEAFSAAMAILLLACFAGIIAYFFAVVIYLISRFYKNKFTDEGYLTFTLPVKVRDIYLASFVNIVLWLLLATVTGILLLFVFALFGTATEEVINPDVLDWFKEIAELPWHELFNNKEAVTTLVLEGIYTLLYPIYMITLVITCITAGAVIAKKHKILMAFAVYYIVNVVMDIFSTVLSLNEYFSSFYSLYYRSFYLPSGFEHTFDTLVPAMVAQILMTAALTGLGYFVSTYLMKRKLNLP